MSIQFYPSNFQLDLKLSSFHWERGGGLKWHFEIWSPKIQLDLKLPNLLTFHFMWGRGEVTLWNLKSNLTWNFQICQLFILWRERGVGLSGIWNLKSQLDLKLPILPTFHFMGGGGRKWHFEIWSPKLDLKLPNLQTFHFTGGGGGGSKVAHWNLKSKNQTWCETSKSANFSFLRGGGGSKVAVFGTHFLVHGQCRVHHSSTVVSQRD